MNRATYQVRIGSALDLAFSWLRLESGMVADALGNSVPNASSGLHDKNWSAVCR